MLLIYDDEKARAKMSDQERAAMFKDYGQFTESIRASGAFQAGAPLQPTSTATTVRMKQGKTVTTDGPFAETKEQLGGFYLIEVPDLNAALDWAARCPAAASGVVEVRPVLPRNKS